MKKKLLFIASFYTLPLTAELVESNSTNIQDQTIVMDIRTSHAAAHIITLIRDRIAILKKTGIPFEVTFTSKTPELDEEYTIKVESLMPRKKACQMTTVSKKVERKKK